MVKKYVFWIVAMLWMINLQAQELKRTKDGKVNFVSEAPLELIKASSENCQGILNLESGEFAFRIFIKTFDGFNNPMQKEHFYENYMEVSQYPDASFAGQLIDQLDLSVAERKTYRAKGELKIHGVSREMIIDVDLEMSETEIPFSASFEVPLADHNIEIPNIVRQKIAEKIIVSVSGVLK